MNALSFKPSEASPKGPALACFTHGYTSHKASILNWAVRLCEEGAHSVIFDLPGHYLGTYSELKSFEEFSEGAPKLFYEAYQYLQKHYKIEFERAVIGGHSLGALLALMIDTENSFKNVDLQFLCVGLGQLPVHQKHLFSSALYKSTLNIRSQLVSEHLHSEIVFPWIKEAKDNLSLTGQRIHFLTGENDLVVGKNGSERMKDQLTEKGNNVSIDKPLKLAHHLPENAAGYIKKYLKSENFF